MIESANTIIIKRPSWFIFSFLSDIERNPIWEQFEMQAIKITPGEVGPGTEYRLLNRNYERTLRVTKYEINLSMEAKTVEISAPIVELRFILQPNGESQTKMFTEWKLKTGTPALIERLIAGKIKSAIVDGLYKLRELLETGRVRMKDGREIKLHTDQSL
jgi:hypothetical protein